MASFSGNITSRRLSQRKSPENYFKDTLTESGITLKYDETSPNILIQEQSYVIRDLERSLQSHQDYPNNIKEFISGFKSFTRNETHYNKSFHPTILKKNDDYPEMQQESLIRIFLNIKSLQSDFIEIILEQITTVSSEETENSSFLRMYLNPLRFLPFINEPKEFTTKILDIVEISTFSSQLELISYIPEIIPDSYNKEAAKELSKLMEETEDLAGAIMECLNCLKLDQESVNGIQEYILNRLLSSTRYYKIFPILFEFLVSECKSESLVNILLKTRNTLDNIINAEENDNETNSNKSVVLVTVKALISRKRNVYEGIINMLGTIKLPEEHKPIDLILVFMLHLICKTKKDIKVLLRQRIKSGLFRIDLFERCFTKYFIEQTFKDFFNSILDISLNLLTAQDPSLLAAACCIITNLFNSKLSTRTQQQSILYNLILLMGSNEMKFASVILEILTKLLKNRKLKDHTIMLMGLLKMVESLSLKDVKTLFNILCKLTCGEGADESQSGHKDEIHMFIRKQLSSYRKDIRHRGIISSVVMAKHIATVSSKPDVVNIDGDDVYSISDLPTGKAQEVALLLELTNKCTSGVADLCGLYYDQLSSMIVSISYMEPHVLCWLLETVTTNFKNVFITETVPESICGVEFSSQYSLNSETEVEDLININIGELTFNPENSEDNILVLPPLFRLLRLLNQKQNNGDLSGIDALLGIGIIMPNVRNLEGFDLEQVEQVADCVFHCINWIREAISAFVTQKKKSLRNKVITRLSNLVELEELLNRCMDIVPNHKLPVAYFDFNTQNFKSSPSKVELPQNKKFKSNPIVNETIATISTQKTQITQKHQAKKHFRNDYNYRFREIDTDIIILLKYPLNILEETEQTQDSQTIHLHIRQFQYILKDIISKLYILTKKKNIGLSHLSLVDPINLIADCQKLIPSIHQQSVVIVNMIKNLLESVDDRYDRKEMFSEKAVDLKIALGLILEFYSLIFCWSGFQQSKYHDLLQNCLKCFKGETASQNLVSLKHLIAEFVNTLFSYVDQCLYLPSAACIVEILQSLYLVHLDRELKKIKVAACENLLKKRWYNLQGDIESGKVAFGHMDVIIKAYLSEANVETLCGLVGTLQEEIMQLQSKEDCLEMFGSIDRANFHVFYRGICTALADRIKIDLEGISNNGHLVVWRTVTLTMQGLMTISKRHQSIGNHTYFLKKSIIILKRFLSHGIPMMEIMLKSKPNQVVEILKILQNSTRFLHHLCCHSKSIKNSTVISYIPQFKSTLESLIYSVKGILVANNCSEAFCIGNLKNKNLEGDDIFSQHTDSMASEQGDEEELPMEDSEDEEHVEDVVNQDRTSDTASEVFDMEF